jgi:hypothetical protein
MAKSVIDIAIEKINVDIAALERAKDIIIAAGQSVPTTAPDKPKRGRPKKKAAPAAGDNGE